MGRRDTRKWQGWMGRPPFNNGDRITPKAHQRYAGWSTGELRQVLEVHYNEVYDMWTLKAPNHFSPHSTSNYNPHNFYVVKQVEDTEMALERTKYFAARLEDGDEVVGGENKVWFNTQDTTSTPLRDTRHQVQVDVGKIVKHGEKWLVLQTVMMIEGEEPRPPMRITEYK